MKPSPKDIARLLLIRCSLGCVYRKAGVRSKAGRKHPGADGSSLLGEWPESKKSNPIAGAARHGSRARGTSHVREDGALTQIKLARIGSHLTERASK